MPFLEVPKCYELYVPHPQVPEQLWGYPANMLTILVGEEWARPRIPIRAEAVLEAFKSLQMPRGHFPGEFIFDDFGVLKNKWKKMSWTEEPCMAAFVERKMGEAYRDMNFPRGNANSVDDIFVAGIDYGTVAYESAKETLQRMMKGINFVLLSSYSHPK